MERSKPWPEWGDLDEPTRAAFLAALLKEMQRVVEYDASYWLKLKQRVTNVRLEGPSLSANLVIETEDFDGVHYRDEFPVLAYVGSPRHRGGYVNPTDPADSAESLGVIIGTNFLENAVSRHAQIRRRRVAEGRPPDDPTP